MNILIRLLKIIVVRLAWQCCHQFIPSVSLNDLCKDVDHHQSLMCLGQYLLQPGTWSLAVVHSLL